MTGRQGWRRGRWGALAACALLAGCGDGPAPHASAAPVVPLEQVQAEATQTRFDEVAVRRFEITITNRGPEPYTVTSVALDSPGFDPAPATPRDDPFPPGIRYDLPASYGPARCGAAATPATAVVRLHRDGGPEGTVRVPLASADGLLQRLHDAECAAAELARQVRVGLTGLRQGPPGVLEAQLHVERGTWTGPVTATELRNSVLFAFTLALPATLPAGTAALDVPVQVRPATCVAHRIADAKQRYLFPLFLELGDAPAREVDLPTTPEQQTTLYALVRTVCGDGTPD